MASCWKRERERYAVISTQDTASSHTHTHTHTPEHMCDPLSLAVICFAIEITHRSRPDTVLAGHKHLTNFLICISERERVVEREIERKKEREMKILLALSFCRKWWKFRRNPLQPLYKSMGNVSAASRENETFRKRFIDESECMRPALGQMGEFATTKLQLQNAAESYWSKHAVYEKYQYIRPTRFFVPDKTLMSETTTCHCTESRWLATSARLALHYLDPA